MKTKIVSIALVLVLLVAALMQISGVVQDRQDYRDVAIQSVARCVAGEQTLMGPLIHVTCTEEWDTLIDKESRTQRREFQLLAAPTTLNVGGNTELEPRSRGLHATQVFNLKAEISAQWADLKALEPVALHAQSRMQCGAPVLMVSVSDSRGIRHASLQVGKQSVALKPATLLGSYPRGVHATLAPTPPRAEALEARFQLELVGTERISVVPLGGDTQVKLASNWPHPSFAGDFLPVERKVTDQGFEASWRVSALASTAQQHVQQHKGACSAGDRSKGCLETFSVTFVDPANTYALSDRATKYGLLFIGLTFLAVGLFEFMKSLRVHPIQYFLVGAAMSMFFLLLVSLSEHLPFAQAYAVAAGACVALLTYYAVHMLQSWARGIPFGLGIAVLYGMLYVLLLIEQTALLVGAVALFALLAAIMLLTRRIDWYARLTQYSRAAPAKNQMPPGA